MRARDGQKLEPARPAELPPDDLPARARSLALARGETTTEARECALLAHNLGAQLRDIAEGHCDRGKVTEVSRLLDGIGLSGVAERVLASDLRELQALADELNPVPSRREEIDRAWAPIRAHLRALERACWRLAAAVRRPRARRSHRTVARIAGTSAATGDPDGDGEPPEPKLPRLLISGLNNARRRAVQAMTAQPPPTESTQPDCLAAEVMS
jgi:hypothetical protein